MGVTAVQQVVIIQEVGSTAHRKSLNQPRVVAVRAGFLEEGMLKETSAGVNQERTRGVEAFQREGTSLPDTKLRERGTLQN